MFSNAFMAQAVVAVAAIYLGFVAGRPMEGILVYIVLSDVVGSVLGE